MVMSELSVSPELIGLAHAYEGLCQSEPAAAARLAAEVGLRAQLPAEVALVWLDRALQYPPAEHHVQLWVRRAAHLLEVGRLAEAARSAGIARAVSPIAEAFAISYQVAQASGETEEASYWLEEGEARFGGL
jgi:hypothetical protein